ncbi:molybdopterin molybdotransferase MoeA [Alteraurantiacibacter aestuarii]|uniref:molybdopterin molybdotransferase MoeA n=1 Tax=Alteraurantiacibacter aestuarii TaxID=650004 RepID=UPI0031DF320A
MSLPAPIPLEQAQARLLDGVQALGEEELPLPAADGRFLAQDLLARRTQPSADLSAMDGYAVRADDLAGPWTLAGESAAGHPFVGELQAGQAIRISTGALMPSGSCAVLLQENALRDGSAIRLAGSDGPTPRHIRRAGFDFSRGDLLVPKGVAMNPARIALGLSGGHALGSFGRRPHVTIIDSGDELAADPLQTANHQIPASNGLMLAALVAPLASSVDRIGPVRDRMEDLLRAFDHASDFDVIVTSGGASVGDHDLIRPALEKWGASLDFWRIAMKPGKPLMVARRGRQIILGLPGNPVSSYVTAFLFLLPLLRRLAGARDPLPQLLEFRLSGDVPAVGSRLEFVRAAITGGAISPLSQQDSSGLYALAASNALIRRDIGAPAASDGEAVCAYLLQNGGIA